MPSMDVMVKINTQLVGGGWWVVGRWELGQNVRNVGDWHWALRSVLSCAFSPAAP